MHVFKWFPSFAEDQAKSFTSTLSSLGSQSRDYKAQVCKSCGGNAGGGGGGFAVRPEHCQLLLSTRERERERGKGNTGRTFQLAACTI